MKSDLTLKDLAAQIMDRAERKQDFIADTRTLVYVPERNELVAGEHAFQINDHAHSQIAAHTEIPAGYYRRMREEAPELLGQNIRTWFDLHPAPRMVRTLDGTARAFLSDKFSRMDDDAFANVVLPAIYDIPGADLGVAEGDAELDLVAALHFAGKPRRLELDRGSGVREPATDHFGAGRLSGSLFAYRLVCLNGMVIEEEQFASTHVGKRHSTRDLADVFKLDTIKADGEATILKLRDFATEILTDRFIDAQVDRMRGLADTPLADPVKAVERLAKQHSFAETQKNDVLKHLIEGGDLSMWGLANAVTRTAEDQPAYDDATRLETLGGRMLTLPKTEYRELMKAAA